MSCNQTGCPGITSEVLVLTENETERDRWLATLEELQKAAKQNTQPGVSDVHVGLELGGGFCLGRLVCFAVDEYCCSETTTAQVCLGYVSLVPRAARYAK